MRVLIFSTAYYPFVGGAEVAIKEITDRLTDVQFDMLTARMRPDLPRFEKIGNISVYRLGIGISFFDKWWLAKWGEWKAFFLSRKNKYDFSWAVMASYGGLAAWWFKTLCPKVPFILTLQEGDEIAFRKFGLVSLAWRFILPKANFVTAISNYLADLAHKHGYRGSIEVVSNGVDIKNFQFSIFNFQKEETRRKIGVKDNEVTLITVSRLVEKNGLEDLIESLQYLPPNIKLIIAGIGPLEEKLKLRIKDLKIKDRVVFLGHVDHNDLPKHLKTADIFVRPSLSEGLGNSFLEAMAAGLPIIGTAVGGIPDFLKHELTGLFCELNSPRSIAEQVMRYVNEPELKRKIIENGRELVREKYDWDRIALKMKLVFNAVASL